MKIFFSVFLVILFFTATTTADAFSSFSDRNEGRRRNFFGFVVVVVISGFIFNFIENKFFDEHIIYQRKKNGFKWLNLREI